MLPNNMKFSVGTGFAVVLALMVALTIIGLNQMAAINERLEGIVKNNNVKTELATSMRDALRDRAISMHTIVVLTDPFEQNDELQRFYGYGINFTQARLRLDELAATGEEKDILHKVRRLTEIAQPEVISTIELALDNKGVDALEVLQNRAIPAQKQLVLELDKLLKLQHDATNQAAKEASEAYSDTRLLMMVLGGSAVFGGMLIAIFVIRRASAQTLEIEKEKVRYQTLFETNSDAIVIFDQTGFIDCNQSALRMFQIDSVAEFIKRSPQSLGPPSQPDGSPSDQYAQKHMQQAMTEGHCIFEWLGIRADSSLFSSEIALHSMNLDGKVVTQAIVHDITERKNIEQKNRAAYDAVVEAARLKSEFVANVSHEIRTPLNGITGMIGLLLDSKLNRNQREYAETVRTSAEALLTIINDILDFSKIEAGKLQLEIIDFDLRETIEEVAELLSERAQSKGLELVCDIQPDLIGNLRGDPGRLRQILINLIDNAIKFTDNGEVIVTVNSMASSENSVRLHFAVNDAGIGITEEASKRIFGAFSQADGSTTRKYGGTGLGLAISRQLTELMGGKIGVESQPGWGSTFWFDLTLQKQTGIQTALNTDDFSALNALIIAPHGALRNMLKKQLSHWKVRNEGTSSGIRAMQMLRAFATLHQPFQIVLIDANIQDLNPRVLAQTIRGDHTIAHPLRHGNPQKIKIILLTNVTDRTALEGTDNLDVDAIISKPLRQMRLYHAITGAGAADSVSLVRAPHHPTFDDATPCRILVAEDNSVNQKVVVYMLHKLGLRADVAANGLEALEALKQIPYDLVLMDCQMPEMDGFQATHEIRQREHAVNSTTRIPIIAMTANALPGDRDRCLAGGMDDYLFKPLKTEHLADMLARWLPGHVSTLAESTKQDTSSEQASDSLDETVPVNLGRLKAIYKNNNQAVQEMLALYLSTTQTLMEELGHAVKIHDAKACTRLAHEIKGASAYMAAQEMLGLASAIEAAAKKLDWVTIERGMDDLEPAFIRTWAYINHLEPSIGREDVDQVSSQINM